MLGEVVNEGEFAAADVQVQIDFPGVGQPLAVPAWVQPPLLPVGGRAPFAALVRQAPEANAPPAVSIVGGAPLLDAGSHYLDLASEVTEATIEDGFVALTGAITNTGFLTATTISVVATFYDTQGRVTGYSQQQLPGPLAPGETAPFALEGTPPGAPVADYRLLVQGLAAPEAAAP